MELDKTEVSRFARPQIMEASNDGIVIENTLTDPVNFDTGKMNIQQVLRRLCGQVIGRLYNQEGHAHRGSGVQPEEIFARKDPLSHPYQSQRGH